MYYIFVGGTNMKLFSTVLFVFYSVIVNARSTVHS